MTNNEAHEAVQKILKEVFDNVNNWLLFAEAKNAAIIVFNIACISIIWNEKWLNKDSILLYIACIGMLISTIVALISFIPQTEKNNSNKSDQTNNNLIFYKDISKYSKKEYIKELFKLYLKTNIEDEEITKLEEDFAEEIVYNSSICVKKFKYFNASLKIEIIMLLILVFMVIIA